MGMAAVPAATTAFGAGAATSIAAAPALTAATAVAAPIALSSASMMMNPLIMNPAGAGGLLGGIGGAFQTIQSFSGLISAGTSVLQGISSLQRGRFMESQYEIQSLQMQAQQEINRLNLIKDANEKARRLMAINASALASGYSRGVNALDGSVKLVRTRNEERYVRDLSALEFNQQSSQYFQDAQSSLLAAAGDEAVRGSKFDAIYHLGSAVKLMEESRIPTYG